MKTTLLTVLLSFLCLFGLVSELKAQGPPPPLRRYTTSAPGRWTNPDIWAVFDDRGNRLPNSSPVAGANNIVTVNNVVVLDTDYSVTGREGELIIGSGGSLSTGLGTSVLEIGEKADQGGGAARLRLTVQQPDVPGALSMQLYKLEFYKAEAIINGAVTLSSCSTLGNNSDIILTSILTISGDLIIAQGNSSINRPPVPARGTLAVSGIIRRTGNAVINVQFLSVLELPTDCSAAPLPVELISFGAKYNNSQVVVRWATASEKNALNFAVERSSDGKNFSSVALVPAAGNSSTRRDYEATDRGMGSGLNYYRLKQTDLDGTFTYSPVVPVQVGEGAPQQRLEAYGNQGNLNIVMQMPGTVQQLRVLDMMGRVLYTESLPEGATGLVTRSVPMSSENRVYMVQAVTSEGVVSKKFATMR